jgi:PAS domain S-box-containing protein
MADSRNESRSSDSSPQFQMLFDSIVDAAFIHDFDGRILNVNVATCGKLGYARTELLRLSFHDIAPSSQAEKLSAMIYNLQENGHAQLRVVYRAKSGKLVPVEASCSIMEYSGDRAVLCIARDVSRQEKIHRALVDSEARYKELFDSIMEGICIVDENEIIRFCNPAFAKILEEDSVAKLKGKNLFDFVPDSVKQLVTVQTSMRRKNISSQYELEFQTARGNRRFILASVSPRLDDEGKYAGAFGALYDITDRRIAEEAVRKARDELELRVRQRTAELETEREILERKNTALKEVLDHIESEKQQISEQLQNNIDQLVFPLIRYLEAKTGIDCEQHLSVIKSGLADITSPFLTNLQSRHFRLTPREIQICEMIRNGLSSKQIASTLGSAEQTVLKQRSNIRRKLGISGQEANLSSYLHRLGRDSDIEKAG